MFSKNFASSPKRLAQCLVYVTILQRSATVLSASLSRKNFIASVNRPRAAACDGQSYKACRSESRTRFPFLAKHAKQQRLKRSLASPNRNLRRMYCALTLAKYSTPAKLRTSACTTLILADGFFQNRGFRFFIFLSSDQEKSIRTDVLRRQESSCLYRRR